MPGVQLLGGAAVERHLTSQALVEGDSRRVDVAGRAGRAALELLGRHVAQRARRHRPVAGQRGDAEVGQLARACPVDEHVGRLVVAVHHALGVGRGQAEKRPVQHDQRRLGGRLAVPLQQSRDGDALDQLHDDGGARLVLDVLVQPDHVRAVQAGQHAGLGPEAGYLPGVAQQARVQVLDRDRGARGVVNREDYFPETAPAEPAYLGVPGHAPAAPRGDRAGCVSS